IIETKSQPVSLAIAESTNSQTPIKSRDLRSNDDIQKKLEEAFGHNIAPIFICPPNADDDLLRQVASYGRGYTYLLSRSGVTGAE
ncbi:AIPR family protein, partial [Salmonella enterica subsp. enterica serovar Virginia]|nr:AIPR family protein [Salmonella enterica subsp. enterica serovar Virginia]